MVNYREILRLKSLNYSNVSVANSCGSSRNTVAEVCKLAQDKKLCWPIPDTLSNKDIEQLLYPERGVNEGRKLPDFEYIYNELAKHGVTLLRIPAYPDGYSGNIRTAFRRIRTLGQAIIIVC